MAEVNFYLRDNKAEKDTGVLLYLSYNGVRLNICTVERINPKFWDATNQRAKQTKSFPTNAEFNARLNYVRNKVQETYRKYLNDNDQIQPSPLTIRTLIKFQFNGKTEKQASKPLTLVSYAENYVHQIETGKRITREGKRLSKSTLKIHKTHLSILKEYELTKQKPITFEDVNLDFYLDFTQYLTTIRKYSINTIGKHIKTLKGILNEATETGKNTKLDFKSKRFVAPAQAIDNVYLNADELKILEQYDFSANGRLDRVRDLFLIGCWTGLRFSDFSTIAVKNIKERVIQIKTQKTGKEVIIPIHPTVRAIINKYSGKTENGLPTPLSNQKMNEYLKEIGKAAGINEIIQKGITKAGKEVTINEPKYKYITTHTARRSFATNAYHLNVPSITIMAITGHSTESSFMKYIKVTPTEHASKLLEIWNRESNLKLVI
ncbi:MAG: site-specific integrase [Mucilaginibacter sp.]|nr:site-specific integrase [Mucilaginibacter sp.]